MIKWKRVKKRAKKKERTKKLKNGEKEKACRDTRLSSAACRAFIEKTKRSMPRHALSMPRHNEGGAFAVF